MSSFIDDKQYLFDQTTSEDPKFIYAMREEGYDEINFKGALEADVDLVVDLENEVGLYRPRLDNSDIKAAVNQVQEYADNQGFDTYNFTFREQDDRTWRTIINSVWRDMDSEEDVIEDELEASSKKQLADGGSNKPVEDDAYNEERASTVESNNSDEEYRFDASEGWDWD